MPGGIEGLFDIFELRPDMKVDEAKMEEDIATYGLFQYEDFAAYLSESVFDALPVKYLKRSRPGRTSWTTGISSSYCGGTARFSPMARAENPCKKPLSLAKGPFFSKKSGPL